MDSNSDSEPEQLKVTYFTNIYLEKFVQEIEKWIIDQVIKTR